MAEKNKPKKTPSMDAKEVRKIVLDTLNDTEQEVEIPAEIEKRIGALERDVARLKENGKKKKLPVEPDPEPAEEPAEEQ